MSRSGERAGYHRPRGGCRESHARTRHRRHPHHGRRRLLRHRRDRPQPPGLGGDGAAARSSPRATAASTRSSSRSGTTARSSPASQYEAPYDNENSFGATYGEHREALELDSGRVRGAARVREGARPGVVRDGLRRGERRSARRARPARVQDRLGRPHEHAAAQARRLAREADGRVHRRRDDRGRRPRRRDGAADQPAALPAPVHGYVSGRRRGAQPRRDHDVPRALPGASSSASPTTRTGSRWRSSPTCSALG